MVKKISGTIERPKQRSREEGKPKPAADRAAPSERPASSWGLGLGQAGRMAVRIMALSAAACLLLAVALVATLYNAPKMFAPVNSYLAEGEIAVPGLAAPLIIRRDANGTPYVFAFSFQDAMFGQGFAMAQDRLFQMETARLYAAGRLAEKLGGAFLPGDRMARTVGFYRLAEQRVTALDAPSLAELEAFCAGVNAFISTRPQDAPAELRLIGETSVAPWRPVDLIAMVYLQSWFFSLPMLDAEITAQAIMERFEGDEARAEAYFPFVENPDAPGSGEARDARRQATSRPYEDLDLNLDAAIWGRAPGGAGKSGAGYGSALESGASGSNNWAFSGARMGRRAALVANDPHLDIRRLPGPWHPIGLFTKDGISAVGAGVGLPGLFLGRNAAVGFGVTVGYADVLDLSIETVDPARPGFYLETEGEEAVWREAQIHIEPIRVLVDGGYRTEELQVAETPRGPLLPDFGLVGRDDRALSLRWAIASPEMAARSSYRFEPLLRATSAAEAIAALEGLAEASLNFVAGDVDGAVARRATGFVPDRALGDGMTPAPAAISARDWHGFLTGPDLPGAAVKSEGWVGSANHSVAPPDFGRAYSDMVSPAWRYRRMKQLFDGQGELSPRLARQAQRDLLNPLAAQLSPILERALETDPERRLETQAAYEVLSRWDRRDTAEAAGPLVFQEILRSLAWRIYEPALGAELARKVLERREFWQERFARALISAEGGVLDEAALSGKVNRDVVIRQATVAAMTTLEGLHGPDPATWRWGDALKIRLDGPAPAPPGFEFAAAPLGYRLLEMSGSAETLDRAHTKFFRPDERSPLEAIDSAASIRMVADLADDEKIVATLAGGVTGRTLHPHLDDQLPAWSSAERSLYWWFSPRKIRENTVTELTLTPAK